MDLFGYGRRIEAGAGKEVNKQVTSVHHLHLFRIGKYPRSGYFGLPGDRLQYFGKDF